MTLRTYANLTCTLVMALAVSAGYGQQGGTAHGHEHGQGHEHGHATEGPHHGSLIELGAEEYHAELVHDEESGKVTIYVLDGAAMVAVPIAATEIVINLKHDGNAEQFELKATPDSADPPGMSSCFASSDPELGKDLDHEGTTAKLVVKIKGKSFRGMIKHQHHVGHDHAHGH